MSKTKRPAELVICMGSSCFSRGNKRNIKLIQEYIEQRGLTGKIDLKGRLCEGLCKEGPNITVHGQVYNLIETESLVSFLDDHIKMRKRGPK